MNMLQERDMVLAAIVLLMAVATFGISHHTRRALATIVRVSLDGTVMKTLDLNKDTEIIVTSSNGDTNHLVVRGGGIWYSEASYPDKVCIHQGKRYLDSDTTVCLPNQMIATIAGGK